MGGQFLARSKTLPSCAVPLEDVPSSGFVTPYLLRMCPQVVRSKRARPEVVRRKALAPYHLRAHVLKWYEAKELVLKWYGCALKWYEARERVLKLYGAKSLRRTT